MAGVQCCSNPPTLNPNSGAGHVEKVGGLDTYVSGSLDSKRAILLVTDIFGYEASKLRKLADKIAAAGFYVVAPDFLYGEPFSYENAARPMTEWLKDHGVDKGFEDAKPVIEDLKRKGAAAIGAAGFCWGAKVVVELSKHGLIQAGVLLHPAFMTAEDIKEVGAPIAILGAEDDHLCPPALMKQFEEILVAKSGIDAFVKVFLGVSHGWTTRYKDEDEAEVKAAAEAHGNLLEWFTKYVK